MQPSAIWPHDSVFIELGVQDSDLALSLRREGYSKYLGVSRDADCIARLHADHPDLTEQFTCSQRRRMALHNNADVLILSGLKTLYLWRFREVRHVQSVAWRFGWHPLSIVAFIACLYNMLSKRCTWPRMVSLRSPDGKPHRLWVSRLLRQKICHRLSLHFIPHRGGLRGMFQKFDEEGVRYVVLRWFEDLPEIEPSADVDMLFDDDSLPKALEILHSEPAIQPCDTYSETGLPRSDFCGTPYYPPRVARRLLDGAVRHKDLCYVPNPSDYFHSLAYHAVYHKGVRSGLPRGETGLKPKGTPGHDYTGILRDMAARLGIHVDISLEGLQAYLDETDWGPTPDMLGRLAAACPRNQWLQLLTRRLTPEMHDQGLAVFVLREVAVRSGFQDQMVGMIEQSGFEILAVKDLSPEEVEYSTPRIRGGNWGPHPYQFSGGPPAAVVVAYDHDPIRPNRKQRRRFPHRTNGRIYVKEAIRDAIAAQLPPERRSNALHSSDHAAEAWHLIEVLAPDLMEEIQARVNGVPQLQPVAKMQAPLRRAA